MPSTSVVSAPVGPVDQPCARLVNGLEYAVSVPVLEKPSQKVLPVPIGEASM